MVVALSEGADGADRAAVADRVAEVVGAAARRQLGSAPTVVCGGLAGSWRAAREALREALAVLPAAEQAPPAAWHDATRPDLGRLLWSLRDEPALRRFVDARLGPLLEHDRGGGPRLVETLEAWCASGLRKADAARALHLRRQSLYNRLARIERVLGANLEDADTVLGLQLALRARRALDDST